MSHNNFTWRQRAAGGGPGAKAGDQAHRVSLVRPTSRRILWGCSNMRRIRRVAFVSGLALAALAGSVALASPPPPRNDDPYKPPMFDYGSGRVPLLEVVRLTLANDPNLLLQREDVRFQAGVLQQLRGAFDAVLSGELSYSNNEQQLTQSSLMNLQNKLQQAQQSASNLCQSATTSDQTLAQLQQARNSAPGAVQVPADASINTQLQFIDSLIAGTTNLTQLQQLQKTRLSFINSEISAAQTNSAQLHFGCTQANDAVSRLGSTPKFEETAHGEFDLRLDKLMRNGITLSPFLTSTYDHDQYPGKHNGFFTPLLDQNGNPVIGQEGTPVPEFIDFGGTNIPDLYKTSVGFQVNLPLLRGSGAASVAGPERNAERDLEAAALTEKFTASSSVLNVVNAYWTLYAAQQRVEVLMRSADLESQMVGITDQLIKGDELPRSERARALAGEATARSQLEGAQRDLVTARLEMVRAMGLGVANQGNAPLAEGPFPTPPAPEVLSSVVDPTPLLGVAIGQRLDLKAARATAEGGAILVLAARLNTRMQFDLNGTVEATGVAENSLGSSLDRWARPGGTLEATFSKPIHNNALIGQYVQAQAQLGQQQITAIDLGRTIQIAVVQDLASLAQAVDRLKQAQLAAQYSQETIDGEVEKLKAGESTLVDAILTEQQRTASLEDLISAQQDVAVLLAQVRFDTGTLVKEGSGGSAEVQAQDLITLPTVGGASGNGAGAARRF
jgi:outer membrane protein TolC